MKSNYITKLTILALFILVGCNDKKEKKESKSEIKEIVVDSVPVVEPKKEEDFVLTEENALIFFREYQKGLKENTVKVTTNHGSFVIELFDDVPYHKANFIYLTKKKYFDGTQFHRIVKDFIIQGGSADDAVTPKKRRKIGRYLLPPDTRKGHKHDRGVVSMPSSDINNPHKLASPYEFFIVVTDPGSYHLDGGFTAFGKVISGMDIVDKINKVPVGKGDWPQVNVVIEKIEVIQ